MNQNDVKRILKRFEVLKTQRSSYEKRWKEAYSLCQPHRQWFDTSDPRAKEPEIKVFDTTAQDALDTWAGGIQGYAVSPAFRFFKLKIANEEKANIPFAQDWLEELENPIYSELNNSNFYDAFDQMVRDVGIIGTGYIYMEDDVKNNVINYSCRHPKECYIAQDFTGKIDTLFRYFRVPVRTMFEKFPDAKFDQEWERLNENDPDAYVDVLHTVFPRGTSGISKIKKPFASIYIDPAHELIIDEGGYNEFPYLVWRLRKSSDEVYGTGIGVSALPDILRINQMAKILLMAGERAANPPFNVPTKLQGRENLNPAGRNYYDPVSGKIEPIPVAGNLPFTWNEYNDQRQQLQNKFYVNFFLILETQQAQGRMTATEVLEKQSEKAAILGAMLSRMNTECLIPLLERIYNILNRRMELPLPPRQLAEEGGSVDIEFLGPLAQAQRRFVENSGIQATVGFITALAQAEGQARQFGATSIDNFDMDELAKTGAQALGAPQKAIREKPDIDKIRQQRVMAEQQAIAQQQALETGKTIAQSSEKMNNPVQKGSMLDAILGGATNKGQ